MAECDEEIAALRAAIAAGVRRVVTQTNGVRKEVEYPSFDDLKRRLEWLESRCGRSNGPRGILASF